VTARVLPPAEWPRLEGTEAAQVWPLLDPARARVTVVEDESGAIVGCWVAYLMVHAECLWIAPAHRGKPSVGRRLLRALGSAVRELGGDRAWTAAITDDVREMLARIGARQLAAADHYVMPLWGK
jgi:hypothetical protein